MSLPPRVLCRAGCGVVGNPELAFLCVDCHGDRADARRERELRHLLSTTACEEASDSAPPPSTRRGPPSINHQRALAAFLGRARETDEHVVARELQFLAREREIRETSRQQLRKFMVATDAGEPADPKEWGRYQFGAPRDVPRHDVDEATERRAQTTLFCAWRKRSLRVRVETRRQLSLAAEHERAKRQSFGAKLLAATPATSAFGGSVPESRRRSLAVALHGAVKEAQRAAVKRASLLLPAKKPVDAPT